MFAYFICVDFCSWHIIILIFKNQSKFFWNHWFKTMLFDSSIKIDLLIVFSNSFLQIHAINKNVNNVFFKFIISTITFFFMRTLFNFFAAITAKTFIQKIFESWVLFHWFERLKKFYWFSINTNICIFLTTLFRVVSFILFSWSIATIRIQNQFKHWNLWKRIVHCNIVLNFLSFRII